jgi:hypothetical protein
MTKRGLIIAGTIGLAAAVGSALLLVQAAISPSLGLVVLGLNIVAAGIAARVVLGTVRVHRYLVLGVGVLSAVDAAILTSATTSYLVNWGITGDPAPTGLVIVTAAIGVVVFLLAATVYVFAARRQGIAVGGRIGLLLLLLLAVIPAANVLGLLSLTITALVRRPAATPAPPAASE